jgi:DeoR family fructose operon transcriptional repressor
MTTGQPSPDGSPRLPNARRRSEQLLAWLAAESRLDVLDAAARLGVAPETVRRDLRVLESDGKLVRVHGGAVPVETEALPVRALPGLASGPAAAPSPGTDADDRLLLEHLWDTLPHTGTLLLGTGRLTLELAQVIVGDPPDGSGLTVVTNSLDVGLVLARASRISVYNIGGAVSPVTRAQEGDWALSELQRLHTDVSVICPAGVSVPHGLSQPTPAAAAVSQAEVAAGERVVALAEGTALGRSSFVTFAGLDEVHRIVAAGRPPAAAVAAFADLDLLCNTAGN